ncbi:ATP-binding protein [Fulvivirga sp.]|uniref:sensor histidine kinase n=1 Tax=Fulvivirga sp. TaxID=1931237 RepID=UPI0032EDECD0
MRNNKRLYWIVSIIGILMLANTIIMYENGKRIEENQKTILSAEGVKLNAEQIKQSLHLLDLGIRAYIITDSAYMYEEPKINALEMMNNSISFLYRNLKNQGYPTTELKVLDKKVEDYFFLVDQIGLLISNSKIDSAKQLVAEDRGYSVWLAADQFSSKIRVFENEIEEQAKVDFNNAIKYSYWLQILLFVITIPTLVYAAHQSVKSIMYQRQLADSEKEKATILEGQNEKLERLVRERTDEILAQNEEITAQNEEISSQNEELVNSKNIIEEQQTKLLIKNEELSAELVEQNIELKNSNKALISQNNKLEQFAYIISHNLRAPIARLLGLGYLIDKTENQQEKEGVIKLMINASKDLNEVIDDMSHVLLIQNPGSKVLETVKFDTILDKVKKTLRHEVIKNQVVLSADFSGASEIYSLSLYIENIFHNLISNAIKYRHEDRIAKLEIKTEKKKDDIILTFADNGLGIDMDRDGEKLFSLYKRFYFHVEGKGMGLYLVKNQVETLGGSIIVDSELGVGTTFTIKLKSKIDKSLLL